MKYLLFAIMCFPTLIMSQDYEKLSEALTNGDASMIGRMMDATVEMTTDGQEQKLGRGDAENRLRTFFMTNSPRAFQKVHEGVSGNDIHYMIGDLTTSEGVYRLTIYLNKSMEEYLIQSIEIDKQ